MLLEAPQLSGGPFTTGLFLVAAGAFQLISSLVHAIGAC
jgi:hypothetical protein